MSDCGQIYADLVTEVAKAQTLTQVNILYMFLACHSAAASRERRILVTSDIQ